MSRTPRDSRGVWGRKTAPPVGWRAGNPDSQGRGPCAGTCLPARKIRNLIFAGICHRLPSPTLPCRFPAAPARRYQRLRRPLVPGAVLQQDCQPASTPRSPAVLSTCQTSEGCPDISLPLMSAETPQPGARRAAFGGTAPLRRSSSLAEPVSRAETWPSPPAPGEGFSGLVPTHPACPRPEPGKPSRDSV